MRVSSILDSDSGVTLKSVADVHQWIVWARDSKGIKKPKDPTNPSRNMQDTYSRPDQWLPVSRLPAGMAQGIILGPLQDGSGRQLCGIDLDSCFDDGPLGDLLPWAKAVVDRFQTYGEVSPSRTGLKLFFLMDAEGATDARAAVLTEDQKGGRSWSGGNHTEIGLTLSHRFYAVTWQRYADTPETLRVVPASDVIWLAEHGAATKEAWLKGRSASETGEVDRSGAAMSFAIRWCSNHPGKTWEEMTAAMIAEGGAVGEWAAEKQKKKKSELRRTFVNASKRSEVDVEGLLFADDKEELGFDPLGDEHRENVVQFNPLGDEPDPAPVKPWRDKLLLNDKGKPRGNVNNAILYLRRHPALKDCLGYDTLAAAPFVVSPFPWDIERGFKSRQVTDNDFTMAASFLQRNGLEVAVSIVTSAVLAAAQMRSFNPLQDYLNGLEWDGTERLSRWLVDYMGVEDSEYSRAVGRMWLVSLVARGLRPGCKADYTLLLYGDQGLGKSSACAIIGGEWFSESMPSIRDGKDAQQALRSKWLIELGELAALGNVESEDLKQFLSTCVDKYRPSYGRMEVERKRTNVFCATTNNEKSLKDATGNRRFWPVTVTRVSFDKLTADRDQIIAEAVAAFQADEKWWPTSEFERSHIRPQQDRHYQTDEWEGAIAQWIDAADANGFTLRQVAWEVLKIEVGRYDNRINKRLTACLKRLGFTLRKTNKHNVWERG